MCGITGFIDLTRATSGDELRAVVTRMADALRHRGPDDAGTWVDPAVGVALGHRRLSILDLSPAGHQPMASHDGRYWIVYNGEIYNHLDLRKDLAARGVSFRSTSDTETLLEAFTAWGIRATIERCRGIFAIAVYDTQSRELTLARDHLGIKPVYFGWQGDAILFGSELKALRAHPAFRGDIDRNVLPQYLRHNYVPGPYSIYQGIQKLPAGTLCTIRLDDPQLTPQPYWSFTERAIQGAKEPLRDDPAAIADRLHDELSRAVSEQMLSDVPLGAFLSGGIDSSLVVALMQSQSSRPVKTFSIGFELDDYNEAPFAMAVAKHLRTDHTECYVTAAQALDVIPSLPAMYNEPYADSSQIPTFLVCQLARQHVTVALSGDGGDELFCGYRRYFAALIGTRGGRLPAFVRQPASLAARAMGRCLPGGKWKKFCNRAASFLNDADPDLRYLRGMSHWPLTESVVRDAVPSPTMFLDPGAWPKFGEPQQRWQWLDTLNYLPDDILTKVDRASMAVSLEARVPLLDPRVVELAWRVPHNLKVRGWTGKQILRDLLARHVPRPLFERPKKGFGVPIAEWLRGPLRDWAEALLSESRLNGDGYFHASPIRAKWAEHMSGRVDWAYLLWDVLMFQAWRDSIRGK
ncbi:MAG TPA: asparagine synthase (glutamine-hydrolyzing) [Planctomycetaceae bacterium]|nr:asparagine synthase (glutamine-hydrolyzing) [Planctomycetaceae bacterium]